MSDFLSCNTLADTGGCPNISMRAEVRVGVRVRVRARARVGSALGLPRGLD